MILIRFTFFERIVVFLNDFQYFIFNLYIINRLINFVSLFTLKWFFNSFHSYTLKLQNAVRFTYIYTSILILLQMENILKNAKQDWMFIILSTVSGFLMIGFYFVLANLVKLDEFTAFLVTLILFSLLFDVRHFFPTYTRTFLDKAYFKENKSWLLGSTAAIFLIPLISYLILIQGEAMAYNGQIVLSFARRVTLTLGFYHLIKQNWGFIAIYKKKFNEPEDGSDRWEKLLLLSGSFIPFVYLAKTKIIWFLDETSAFSPNANELNYVLEFWGKISAFMLVLGLFFLVIGFAINARPQYKYVSRNLGYYFVGIFILIKLILANGSDKVLYILLVVLTIIFVVSLILTVLKAIQFGKLNVRKWAMFISALVLYWGVLSLPLDNKMLIIIGITIPHNISINYNIFKKGKNN